MYKEKKHHEQIGTFRQTIIDVNTFLNNKITTVISVISTKEKKEKNHRT